MALVTGLRASDELYGIEDESDDFGILQVAQGIAGIQFSDNENGHWQDIDLAEKFYTPPWASVHFRALPDPAGSEFPENQPVWGDLAHGQAGEQAVVHFFGPPSQNQNDIKNVSCVYGNDDLAIDIIAYSLQIFPEGGETQVRAIAPGDDTELQGVAGADTPGSYSWKQWENQDGAVILQGDDQQEVTVVADASGSATVQLEFSPEGQGVDWDSVSWPYYQFCIVEIDRIQYRIDDNDPWEDAPETLYVPLDAEVHFKAIPDPAGADWPEDYPEWGGAALTDPVTIGEHTSVVFDESGHFIVSADCGNVVSANVTVVKVTGIDVWDSDGRHAHEGLLEVVPPYDLPNVVGECIFGEAFINPDVEPPDEYPKWVFNTISKYGLEVEYEDGLEGYEEGGIILAWVEPKTSIITCEEESVTLKRYPANQGNIGFNTIAASEIVEKLTQYLSYLLLDNDIIIEAPAVYCNFENQWKEQVTTNLVGWTFDFDMDADPLFSADIKASVKPDIVEGVENWFRNSFIGERITKYVADIDVELEAKINTAQILSLGISKDEYNYITINPDPENEYETRINVSAVQNNSS